MTRISRRTLLKTIPVAAMAGGIAVAGGASQLTTNNFEVVTTRMGVLNLPAEFEGYKIAFLSDLHCGITFPLEWIHQALELAQGSKANLLLLGGDYLWIPSSPLARSLPIVREEKFVGLSEDKMIDLIFRSVAEALGDYHFEDGICAVYGNHDRWESPGLCTEHFTAAGVQFLVNSDYTVQRGSSSLLVYGADDFWTGFPRFPSATRFEKQQVSILLAHNPDFHERVARFAPQAAFHFGLAGHTHGGQILPFKGMPLVTNIENPELREGLCESERFPIYTTRGIGVVEIPYRFNCPPEVSIIELHRI